MATLQLTFSLRTNPRAASVHLLGSWDNYQGQLPLSMDPSSKSGSSWTGTFRFAGGTLQQGQVYWYYYIMNGTHATHDPKKPCILEPTTKRYLNVLEVPYGKGSSKSASASARGSSRRVSRDIPRGRGVSPSKIRSPMPYNPVQTANIVAQGYSQATVDELTARFGYANIAYAGEDSDADSDVPSLSSSRSSTSRTSNSSSPSSVSSDGSSCCTCERYGITRTGNRVQLDCGGARCGYAESSSDCASDSDAEYRRRATRRHGVVVRG